MDLYFILPDGGLLVVPEAPEGYFRDDGSVQIDAPPPHDPETYQAFWRDGKWVIEPRMAPTPSLIEISAEELFFGRMTDDEYDALDDSVRSGESARIYRGWAAATSFSEGTAMWELLAKHLSLIVTAERKVELLARPVEAAAFAEEAIAA